VGKGAHDQRHDLFEKSSNRIGQLRNGRKIQRFSSYAEWPEILSSMAISAVISVPWFGADFTESFPSTEAQTFSHAYQTDSLRLHSQGRTQHRNFNCQAHLAGILNRLTKIFLE
jgi:hypothetical protein